MVIKSYIVSKNNIYILVGVSLFLILIGMTMLQTQVPFWDEEYYLENVVNLNNIGFSKQYLIDYKGPAGPTFALIHYLLQPITNLDVPLVRLVNIVFLLGIIYLLYRIFLILNNTKYNSIVFSISSLSIVTIYTISGLVLTEIFAIFFLSVTLYFIVKYYTFNKNNYIIALLSGLSFSLAILGRQPMIVLWLALPFLFLKEKTLFEFDFSKKEFNKFILLTVISSLIAPIIVFYIWGNIQPTFKGGTEIRLSPTNLVLALGYTAIFSIFINPNYFSLRKILSNKKELLIVVILSILINMFLLKIEFAPFKTIVTNLLPSGAISLYELCCGSVLAISGFSFLYFFLKKEILKGGQLTLFFVIGFLLIIGTSLKVTHQFSARYVAQAFPLIVLVLHSKNRNISWVSVIMLILGGGLGLASLNSYFE